MIGIDLRDEDDDSTDLGISSVEEALVFYQVHFCCTQIRGCEEFRRECVSTNEKA
jgi:hypothetical protein